MRLGPVVLTLVVLVTAVGLGGCSGADDRADDGRVQIEASFYPLQWVAQQVGGRFVDVASLTKPGAEPHDLELTPRAVGSVQDADVVLYLSGFQPAVDDAVDDAEGTVFDARSAADLDLTFSAIEDGSRIRGGGTSDPHFWLDPTRLAAVVRGFTAVLAERDPAHAVAYRANARTLIDRLGALDRAFRSVLLGCAHPDLVTSHNAFGYLARRYGLRQVGITGLTPDEEPSPGQLAAVTDYVRAHHVRTIYFETLVSPSIAKTVARETGARTAVLDPIEAIDDHSAGSDYLEIMRSNLRALEAGQPCR